MRLLVGGDPVRALERERDVVEALDQHVPGEVVELEPDPEAAGMRDLARLEVDGQLVLAGERRP